MHRGTECVRLMVLLARGGCQRQLGWMVGLCTGMWHRRRHRPGDWPLLMQCPDTPQQPARLAAKAASQAMGVKNAGPLLWLLQPLCLLPPSIDGHAYDAADTDTCPCALTLLCPGMLPPLPFKPAADVASPAHPLGVRFLPPIHSAPVVHEDDLCTNPESSPLTGYLSDPSIADQGGRTDEGGQARLRSGCAAAPQDEQLS